MARVLKGFICAPLGHKGSARPVKDWSFLTLFIESAKPVEGVSRLPGHATCTTQASIPVAIADGGGDLMARQVRDRGLAQAIRFWRCGAELFSGRLGLYSEGVNVGGKLLGENGVDHAVTVNPALARECI